MSSLVPLIVAFVGGAIAVVAAEAVVVYFIVRRIVAKSRSIEAVGYSPPRQISGAGDLVSSDNVFGKQGVIWILEPQKVPKVPVPEELNRKGEFIEVFPVPRSATIKGKYMILTEPDGTRTTIMLKGCKVVAVSSMNKPTKKWDKRYPIKVETNNVLYGRSKILYIYLETCWEKESWCKALRVASCDHQEKVDWFLKLNKDFVHYLRTLNEGYPALVKPSGYQFGLPDRLSRPDPPPSKVSLFLKKLAAKASKNNSERKAANVCMENDSVSSTKSVDSGNMSLVPGNSNADDGKTVSDEGTLCWNLLISRLFFDFKSDLDIKNSMKARIQRTLSNMRTPSYIGAMMCTDIYTGNLPPHIRSMKAVPTDMNDTWALEMDVEYVGDMVLYVEVRLEVQDKHFQNGKIDPNAELSTAAEVTTDLLQGFERIGEELNCSDATIDSAESKNDGSHEHERVKSFKISGPSATSGSRWKSIINSVANQVSQVPFLLAIRVASLRGTLQLRIKSPPSDQLWYGFTCMPDIDLQLESFVGEHKITNRHISLYLVNRFKAAVRENLVFPNCECLCIPWMLAEKEDWVPKSVAPFIWLKREVAVDSGPINETSNINNNNNIQSEERTTKAEASKGKPDNSQHSKANEKQNKDNDSSNPSTGNSSDIDASSSSPNNTCSDGSESNGTMAPLLLKYRSPETLQNSPRYVSLKDQQTSTVEEDDGNKPKKTGRRARMIDLGKKMGEKLEEKRRHLEEKRKHIADKMRGP